MEWLTHDKSNKPKPVCNFFPEVLSRVDVYEADNTEPVQHVKLRFVFANGDRSGEIMEPLSKLEKITWSSKDARCRFHPDMSSSKAQRRLADLIRSGLTDIPVQREYHINRAGMHDIEGEVLFCTGRELIRSPTAQKSDVVIKVAPMVHDNLDIDPEITEADATSGVFKLISLCPNPGRVILTLMVMYFMRSAYAAVWKAPRCCVFLHGPTGTKKTTFAAMLTQLYNRAGGIASLVRLNSTVAAAMNIILERNDCVVVFDDLFPANDNKLKRKQEETLCEITRAIADGIEPARMKGWKVTKSTPICGALFTAEYLFGIGSDAARLLSVEMQEPDDGELKLLQDKPLLLPTFYYYFLRWLIEHYSEVCDLLKDLLVECSKVELGINKRLQETGYFFHTAFAILMKYCHDRGFLSEEVANAFQTDFLCLIGNLLLSQQKRVEQGKTGEAETIDYLTHIRSAYRAEEFVVAKNVKEFKKGQHDGVIHNGELCLRGDALRKLFPNVRVEDIAINLSAQGAFRTGKDSLQIQLSGANGARFYAIPLNKLQ